ncbi:uncharacterized protein LOC119375341 [Rhipicephalus sanguineus]|uniref:uncharacterized protein LOC119375341 n=1 Tax=Rhipicephalus sanguineus TaxID=34632 RepID=UPI00189415CB|nr:uncharacterized protein LOC119375341 [Rhipicephalus sanguineus]
MDFFTDNGAIIDLPAKSISFSADHAVMPKPSAEPRASLRIADDHDTLPPRSSLTIAVFSRAADPDSDAIVENDHNLLLDRGVSVARGIVRLKLGKSHVLITNFTDEYQHLNKGAFVAFLEEIQEHSAEIAVADFQREPNDALGSAPFFDVNPALPQEQLEKLTALLLRYSDCFSTTSKLRQTPLAKRRITTEDGARPTRQSPYRVSLHEREAIRTQVEDMLTDDIIQPSKRPWAAPVVLVKKKDGTLRFSSTTDG